MVNTLAGSVVIVTGGGNGIGKAIASRLGSEGCKVEIWDINQAALDNAVTDLKKDGISVNARAIDVSQLDAVRDAVGATVDGAGAPDILINSAAILGEAGSILDSSPERFDATMRVNVRGIYNCCSAVAPLMVARQRGSIVNLASWSGKTARPNSLAYSTSKFAVIGLTQSMAIDLAAHGVRVNAVCPGVIGETTLRTESDAMFAAKGLPQASDRLKLIPLGRWGKPVDVANLVAFLVSDQSSYMTGQAINITGGLWMH